MTIKERLTLLCFGTVLIASASALAQQPSQSPETRALMLRIGSEVNANISCSSANIDLSDKLKASEAEVKRLTDKYEGKKDEKPK